MAKTLPSMDDLSIFFQVAESGSFSKASDILSLPSSTVSRRIQKLEHTLKVRLFNRNSRKVVLTDAGLQLLERTNPAYQQIHSQLLAFMERDKGVSGEIRVCAPIFLGQYFLMRWISEFEKQYPGVNVRLHLENRYDDLIEHQADFAIRVGPLTDSQLISRCLYRPKYKLAASRAYLSERPEVKSPDDLRDHRLLLAHPQSNLWRFYDKTQRETYCLNAAAKVIGNDLSLLVDAIRGDRGIGPLPCFFVKNAEIFSDSELEVVLPEYTLPGKGDIYAVLASREYLPNRVRLLIDYIRDQFTAFESD